MASTREGGTGGSGLQAAPPRPSSKAAETALGLVLVGLSLAACAAGSRPYDLGPALAEGGEAVGIGVLATVELMGDGDGVPMAGRSGITWDDRTETLFAVSGLGYLWRLRPRFHDRDLLVQIAEASPTLLHGPSGKPLPAGQRDAEDLALVRDPAGSVVLLVVFEGEPRLYRYDAQSHWLGAMALPAQVAEAARFRNPNKSLEALLMDPRWGQRTLRLQLMLPAALQGRICCVARLDHRVAMALRRDSLHLRPCGPDRRCLGGSHGLISVSLAQAPS